MTEFSCLSEVFSLWPINLTFRRGVQDKFQFRNPNIYALINKTKNKQIQH